MTAAASRPRAWRRGLDADGCFLKRVGAFLRLETLCPKLRRWNLVSWRVFLGLVARGLKSNSMSLFSKGSLDSVLKGLWNVQTLGRIIYVSQ